MNIHPRLILTALVPAALALLLVFSLSGCASGPEDSDLEEVSIRETVTDADPQGAVRAIYDTLPDAMAEDVAYDDLEAWFTDLDELVDEYYGKISSPNGGLSDVLIVKPATDGRDGVRNALGIYQDRRVREFERYDILDAYDISRNAVIFDQGEYVILLMLADNEAAREIIDQYMPL